MIYLTAHQLKKSIIAFESYLHKSACKTRSPTGEYSNASVQHDWEVWIASQKSLVVKLPYAETRTESIFLQEVIEELEKSGINYNQG